jgi:hypothetical protein
MVTRSYYLEKGCQIVCFQTKNTNFDKMLRALECKMWLYVMTIWNSLRPFGTIYGLLVYFVVIWYIVYILVCLEQEESGNPDLVSHYMYIHMYDLQKAPPGLVSVNVPLSVGDGQNCD